LSSTLHTQSLRWSELTLPNRFIGTRGSSADFPPSRQVSGLRWVLCERPHLQSFRAQSVHAAISASALSRTQSSKLRGGRPSNPPRGRRGIHLSGLDAEKSSIESAQGGWHSDCCATSPSSSQTIG
jgi:hypothetical protein